MTVVFRGIDLGSHLPHISLIRVSGTDNRCEDRLWFCSPHLVLPVSRWFCASWLDRLNAAQADFRKTNKEMFSDSMERSLYFVI